MTSSKIGGLLGVLLCYWRCGYDDLVVHRSVVTSRIDRFFLRVCRVCLGCEVMMASDADGTDIMNDMRIKIYGCP